MNWTHEFRLSSPLEITAAAEKELPEHAKAAWSRARSNPSPLSFTGNVTYSEAVTLANTGWPDAPKLGDLAEVIAPSETRPSFEMQHAVTGAFVDVARFVEGHPENMLEFCDEPAPRNITLAVQIGKHSEVSARSMELAGAVAVAVTDTLARSGYRVEIIGTSGSRNKAFTMSTLMTFPIKRASEPLDLNQLAFWLCHPAAYRHLVFGWRDVAFTKAQFKGTLQHDNRGYSHAPTAAEAGADYVINTSPADEHAARREYHRIISEITAIL